jgi:PAT family beta-lactamase induction signal transducer AmpG
VPRVLASAGTGFMVTGLGWTWFFVACTLIAIPGMLCIPRLKI